jgi:hypothetical protein
MNCSLSHTLTEILQPTYKAEKIENLKQATQQKQQRGNFTSKLRQI